MHFLNRLIILTGATALLMAFVGALLLFGSENTVNQTPLAVKDVQPPALIAGEGGELLVSGHGFNGQTRAALFFDTGNRRAVVGKLKSISRVSGLTSRGSLVYMASAHSGLQILDLSRPESPRILGTEKESFEAAWDIALAGSHALVADVRKGLVIIDVSFPERPRKVGQLYDSRRKSWGVSLLSEDVALLAQGLDGVAVIDISEPEQPREIARIDSRGFSWNAKAEGDLVYLCDGQGGLYIYDLSVPTAPRPMGHFDTFGHVRDLALLDNMVFLADGREGLTVVDVADPMRPAFIAAGVKFGNLTRIMAFDGRIYTAGSNRGLLELDADDPTQLRTIGQMAVPGAVRAMTAVKDHIVIADGIYGIQIVRRDMLRPIQAACTVPARGRAYAMAEKDGVMAIAEKEEGVRFFSKKGADEIQFFDKKGNAFLLRDLAVHEDVFWVAGGPQGLLSFRLKRPDLLTLTHRLVVPREINQVRLYHDGHRALLGAGGGGVLVVDTSDPVDPEIKHRLLGYGQVMDLEVREKQAWVIERAGRLLQFDLGDPDQPRVISSLALPGPINQVRVVGDMLFVTRVDQGMHLVDIDRSGALSLRRSLLPQEKVRLLWAGEDYLLVQVSDPDLPAGAEVLILFQRSKKNELHEVARVPAPGIILSAAEGGGILYLADYNGSLWGVQKSGLPQLSFRNVLKTSQTFSSLITIGEKLWGRTIQGIDSIDISDPLAPRPQAVALDSYQDTVAMSWRENHLFIVDAFSGIHIYRKNEQGPPDSVASLGLKNDIRSWDMDGHLGYALSLNGKLRVIDTADPAHPQLLTTLDMGGSHQSLAVRDGFALVASGADGVQVWDVSDLDRAHIAGEIALSWPESEFIKAHGVSWDDDLAVIAVGPGGVLILDMSDPPNPRIVGRFNGTGYALDVWMHEGVAYVTTPRQGLLVLDLKNPSQPVLMGKLENRGQVRDLMFDPPYVWMALDSSGVIAAPMPIEATQVVAESEERLRVVLPDPPLPGSYILNIFSPQENQVYSGGIDYFPPR
jgi:hypothetical protein